jgi:hypothetical protein
LPGVDRVSAGRRRISPLEIIFCDQGDPGEPSVQVHSAAPSYHTISQIETRLSWNAGYAAMWFSKQHLERHARALKVTLRVPVRRAGLLILNQ